MEYVRPRPSRFPKASAIGEILSTSALAGIGVGVALLAWAAFTGLGPETSLEPFTSTSTGVDRTTDGFFAPQPAGASILVIASSDIGAREAESLLLSEMRVRKLTGEPLRTAWVVTAASAEEAAAIAELAARDSQLTGAQQVTVVLFP